MKKLLNQGRPRDYTFDEIQTLFREKDPTYEELLSEYNRELNKDLVKNSSLEKAVARKVMSKFKPDFQYSSVADRRAAMESVLLDDLSDLMTAASLNGNQASLLGAYGSTPWGMAMAPKVPAFSSQKMNVLKPNRVKSKDKANKDVIAQQTGNLNLRDNVGVGTIRQGFLPTAIRKWKNVSFRDVDVNAIAAFIHPEEHYSRFPTLGALRPTALLHAPYSLSIPITSSSFVIWIWPDNIAASGVQNACFASSNPNYLAASGAVSGTTTNYGGVYASSASNFDRIRVNGFSLQTTLPSNFQSNQGTIYAAYITNAADLTTQTVGTDVLPQVSLQELYNQTFITIGPAKDTYRLTHSSTQDHNFLPTSNVTSGVLPDMFMIVCSGFNTSQTLLITFGNSTEAIPTEDAIVMFDPAYAPPYPSTTDAINMIVSANKSVLGLPRPIAHKVAESIMTFESHDIDYVVNGTLDLIAGEIELHEKPVYVDPILNDPVVSDFVAVE